MSVTEQAPPTPAPRFWRTTWRRHRPWWIVGALLAVLMIASVLLLRNPGSTAPLDPLNPQTNGAKAVAQVLEDQGVEVSIVRGADQVADEQIDANTTVVVTNPGELGPSTLRSLRKLDSDARIVLAGDGRLLADLTAAEPGPPTDGPLAARCENRLFRGLTIDTEAATTFRVAGAQQACFRTGTGAVLVQDPRDSRTWLLTAGDVLSNERVLEADNAAIALRLLGENPRLIWYLADSADTVATDGRNINLFLPKAFWPALTLVLLAGIAYVFWRGRRLGPLSVEPLPVSVRAIETTESRGRLYHSAGDRDHAARILAEAVTRRLRAALALPQDTDVDAVAESVGARLDRDPDDIRRLLRPAPLPDDTALARLGHDLLTLENEVRHP